MVRSALRSWFVLCFFALSAGAQDNIISQAEAMKIPIFNIVSMTARLGWKYPEPYYGTALQFSFDKTSTYFIAAYHTLPRNRDRWKDLTLTTPDGAKAGAVMQVPAQVIGVWPNYEIAVLRVDLTNIVGPVDVAEEQKFLDSHYITGKVSDKDWRVGVVGIADAEARKLPSLTRVLWSEEAELLSSMVPITKFESRDNVTLARQWRASDTVHHLTISHDCQPSEIEECYQIPMRTLGYSGGAFLVAPPHDAMAVKIAGIVWGYSPLARSTYVIPWPFVHQKATRILEQWKSNPSAGMVELNQGANDLFTYVGPNQFQLKSGEEKMLVSSARFGGRSMYGGGESSGGGGESSGGGGESSGGGGESSGGGGESSGGGGESSGGGGESSGGGGESSGGGGQTRPKSSVKLFLNGSHDVAAILSKAAFEQELAHPESWHQATMLNTIAHAIEPFRGVRALLNYQPGIEIDGKHIYRFDGKPIINLSDFVRAFQKNPEGKMEESFASLKFPQKLSTIAGNNFDRYGTFTQTSLHLLKRNLSLGTHLLPHELEAMKSPEYLKNKSDLLIYRQDIHSIASSAASGSIVQESDRFIIELECSRLKGLGTAKAKYVSHGPLEQHGDYFLRYAGEVTYYSPLNYPLEKVSGKPALLKAVVSLQYDPEMKRYELKIFSVGFASPNWDEISNFYPEHQALGALFEPGYSVLMQSAYMPLYRAE